MTRGPRRLLEAMRPRRTQRLRLLAPAWYEARYGIPRDEAEAHYVKEGHVLGLAPTPLFDVAWYRDRYGPTPGPPLAELERHAWEQAPNRWLDPSTLRTAGIAERDVLGQLAAARIRLDDPRTLAPTASAVARVWRGDRVARDGAEVVVLAHYDAPGVMSPAFLDLVGAFAAADRDVVVCSTSVAAAGEGLDAVLPLTHAVCAVPNTGHDWGAYQAGLRFVLDELAPRSVVLANDSVYVVPDRLGPFLDRLGALDADLAGATDSDELVPHLQSYLLRLSSAALSGPLVEELLTTYVPLAEKELVIHSYELGFCRRAREHGMELGAVHPLRELAESALREGTATESVLRRIDSGIPVTPPLHLWRPLLQDGFPFLKRQLLRDEMAPRELLAELVPEQVLALAEEDIAARRARGL